ncbi:MAG: hypothetical protein NWE89_08655 [Candidatus Bathyarchaeota archaeon]|nr:hypothetical protein [Candidatus Bathyarchaeota archaeon]
MYNHLLSGERILASCKEGKYTFYSTDKRVLKFKPDRKFDSRSSTT